jgi:hypothetical protein
VADTVSRLTSRARRGEFHAVLPALRAVAERDDAPADDRWQAAAGAITIMFWLDEFVAAADLAVAAIGTGSGPVRNQDYPFDMALLAAEVHGGQQAAPRLARLAEVVPVDSVLGRRCAWLAGQAETGPIDRLLPNHSGWGADPKPLAGVHGAEYLDADYADLPVSRRRALWSALNNTDQGQLAWDLMERTGDIPPQWPVCVWLAGWCARSGRAEDGTRLIERAHDGWTPYARWDCLPSDLVLQPVLRTVVTDELRELFLTRPIGPEARKKR